MAVKIPRPRATVAACAAATAAALAVGAALPAGAVAYTASAGPWGPAVSLTGADGQQSLIDVQVAGDGTAFALWRNKAVSATAWDIQAVVRPAGSDKWAAPHTLFTSGNATAPAVLTVTADGHAEAAWTTGTYTDGSLAAVSAKLGPGDGPVVGSDHAHGLRRTGPVDAPAGRGSRRHCHRRMGPGRRRHELRGDDRHARARRDGLVGASPSGGPSPTATSSSSHSRWLPDGAATTVWDAWDRTSDSNVDSIVTRATPGGDWSSPAALPGADAKSTDVEVSMAANGATTVLWQSATNGVEKLKSLSRPSPTGSWGAVQTAAPVVQDNDDSGPLVAPNGDVTYVWAGWTGSAGMPIVQAVTRSASTGTWSAPRTLSTGYVDWQVDASIGADGTVQVVWPQTPGIDNGDDHYLEWAVR
ncbi:hypothetical protein HEP87_57595 [Streptomyces sp. S1D4-11]